MATVADRILLPSSPPYPARRGFTRDEYYRMAEAGVLSADDRVELLGGEIVLRSPIGPGHQSVADLLNRVFTMQLGDRAICRVQGPLVLDDRSEPEPDVQLLRPRADFYRSAHPTPADVLLVVEIAESSAAFDRGPKMAMYARAGVGEYWVVDLARSVVVVHRGPTGEEYALVTQLAAGASVGPEAFPDCSMAVGDLFR